PDETRPDPLPADYVAYLRELRDELSKLHEFPPYAEVIGRGPFGPVEEAAVPHDHVLDREGLLGNARSVSWIASRDDDDRERVLARLASLLPEGTYSIPNLAHVMWAERR